MGDYEKRKVCVRYVSGTYENKWIDEQKHQYFVECNKVSILLLHSKLFYSKLLWKLTTENIVVGVCKGSFMWPIGSLPKMSLRINNLNLLSINICTNSILIRTELCWHFFVFFSYILSFLDARVIILDIHWKPSTRNLSN